MWDKLAGTDAKPGRCGACGSSNVLLQRHRRLLRRTSTYAICQSCGKTTPLGGLLKK